MWTNIEKFESILDDGILFLAYAGNFTQSLIAGMTEALEKEVQSSNLTMNESNKIFIVFIELAQNIMNYAKSLHKGGDEFDPKGLIYVGKKDGEYFVCSQNLVTASDKDALEQKLKKLKSLTLDEIKDAYCTLRKTGENKHIQGGGLGLYEMAKKSKKIDYTFWEKSVNRYYFKICIYI